MKLFSRNNKKQITPSLEERQLEKLRELGHELANIRKQKGLNVDDLISLTRIPGRILLAIEEGNLSDLPEPVYIQGLIRQFADALGLKGREFASSFPVGSLAMTLPKNVEKPSMPQFRPLHLYFLYIVVIFCSVNGLSQLLNNATLPNNKREILTRNFTEKPQQIVKKNDQPVEVGVTLKAESWVRVIADGKTQFEGVLPQGSSRIWKASQELAVRTNNAGGVLMSVNKQQPKEMGEIGKIGEVKIAAKPNS